MRPYWAAVQGTNLAVVEFHPVDYTAAHIKTVWNWPWINPTWGVRRRSPAILRPRSSSSEATGTSRGTGITTPVGGSRRKLPDMGRTPGRCTFLARGGAETAGVKSAYASWYRVEESGKVITDLQSGTRTEVPRSTPWRKRRSLESAK